MKCKRTKERPNCEQRTLNKAWKNNKTTKQNQTTCNEFAALDIDDNERNSTSDSFFYITHFRCQQVVLSLCRCRSNNYYDQLVTCEFFNKTSCHGHITLWLAWTFNIAQRLNGQSLYYENYLSQNGTCQERSELDVRGIEHNELPKCIPVKFVHCFMHNERRVLGNISKEPPAIFFYFCPKLIYLFTYVRLNRVHKEGTCSKSHSLWLSVSSYLNLTTEMQIKADARSLFT